MDDMTSAINNILNDPEQMQKVMDMAGQIMGNSGSAPQSGTTQAAPSLEGMLSSLGSGGSGIDPQFAQLLSGAGAKLSGLLSGGGLGGLLSGGGLGRLFGGGGGASPLSGLLGGGAGGGLTAMLGNAARSMSGSNDKKQLVEALKPWLSESRQAKLDRAMIFAKVMRVAGAAALLGEGQK